MLFAKAHYRTKNNAWAPFHMRHGLGFFLRFDGNFKFSLERGVALSLGPGNTAFSFLEVLGHTLQDGASHMRDVDRC